MPAGFLLHHPTRVAPGSPPGPGAVPEGTPADPLNWSGTKDSEAEDCTALAYVDGVIYAARADNANSPVPNYSDGTSYLDIYMGSGTPPSP